MKQLLYIWLLSTAVLVNAQQAVTTQVDRDSILMGEEVKLGLSIDATPTDLVIFPEQVKMGAMEVIESYPIDTIRENDKMRLFKEYGITQWDSGDYKVPQLTVIKNDKPYLTDSLLIKVREVQVDTTKQKMFPIKEAMEIPDNRPTDWSWLWWLLLLIPIGFVVFMLSRKREKKTYEETLQPYEWTRYRLGKLDDLQLMEQRRAKEYYTELTYIIRKYIDSKVYGQTLESTTGQLLSELKVVMQERGMNITTTTENRLQEILERADLVKFAGIAPDAITAKEDRLHTTDIIYNIHQVLPPPTQEELMQDARYRRQQEIKAKTQKIALGIGAGIIAIALALGTWVYFSGVNEVKDQVLGNELRELQEQDWYTSNYGLPEITISTPEILVRQDEDKMPKELEQYLADYNHFQYGENGDDVTITLATLLFNKNAENADISPDKLLGPITNGLEEEGATNIILFDSPLEHDGMEGLEFSGSFDFEGDSFDYDMWIFTESGGMQQILVTHIKENEEDPAREFGRLIKERVLQSIKINKLANDPSKQKQQ